ncbi:MAG: hypothetical protein V4561_00040 [Bacteroidota bacterium]
MKKFLSFILIFILSSSFYESKAQSSTTTKNSTARKEVKMKKDGTPDMRYKENKSNKKAPAQHLKKDGTPDKRYKENKK